MVVCCLALVSVEKAGSHILTNNQVADLETIIGTHLQVIQATPISTRDEEEKEGLSGTEMRGLLTC